MLSEMKINDYIDLLASDAPAPGGGSASRTAVPFPGAESTESPMESRSAISRTMKSPMPDARL